MRLISATLEDVKPSRPWNERVILGFWAVSFKKCYIIQLYLTFTSLVTFLCVPNISQPILQLILDLAFHTPGNF
jgi:hypothetical protein